MRRSPTVDPVLIHAYLGRLGLESEPPSVEALHRLHQAHVERVPYETIWIHLEQRWDIDPQSALERIANQGRGGYCYHLNGAFALLLRELGYSVFLHAGGVFGPIGPAAGDVTNHLVLTVRDLPSVANPAGVWYADVGLGDALHQPLPLKPGSHAQGPFRYQLAQTPGQVGDWRFDHDLSAGSFRGMTWRNGPVDVQAFVDRHHWLSTSPDSRFTQVVTVQRRDASGADALRGRVLRRVGDRPSESVVPTPGEWFDTLAGTFGLDLRGIDTDRRDVLWHRVVIMHEEWVASQQGRQSSG